MSEGFWRIAERDAGRVALVTADGEVTAGALLASANQIVHGMRTAGLRTGAVVAVAMKNRSELLALVLAAAQAGFYLVPINVRLAPSEIAYVLRDCKASMLVIDASVEDVVGAVDLPHHMVFSTEPSSRFQPFTQLWHGQPTTEPGERVLGETIFYTSGTTGVPRAVHRPLSGALPDRASATAALLRLRGVGIGARASARHLVVSPLYHSAALGWCTAHLHAGHLVVMMDEWSPEKMLELVATHRITGSFMVPTHFVRLLALPEDVRARFDVTSLRHVVHGGAPCRVDVKQRMMQWWGPVIHEVYGAAEAAGGTYVSPAEWLARPGTVGKTRGTIRVLRDDGIACEPREVGAVYFESRGPRFEYLNDAEKTAASWRGALFTVGDLGYLDEDGYLFLSDRRSDLIISGGVNIYPAEIEAVLCTHPHVADVAVFGIPDDEWGEQVKAVVQPLSGAPADDELVGDLVAYCRERLASFKCPRSIDLVTALPRDPNGKMYKRRLRDAYWKI